MSMESYAIPEKRREQVEELAAKKQAAERQRLIGMPKSNGTRPSTATLGMPPSRTTKSISEAGGLERLAAVCARRREELSCALCDCGLVSPPPAPRGMESRRAQFLEGLLQFCTCDVGLRVRARYMEQSGDKRFLPQEVLLLRNQAEAAKKRKERLWADAQIPPRYASYTFDSYVKATRGDEGKQLAIAAIKRYHAGKSERKGLMLCGPTNLGKTGALCPLFAYFVEERGYGGLWLPYKEMMRELRNFEKGGVHERIEVAKTIDYLFIDDMGDTKQRQATDYERGVVWEIVDHRNSYGLPMLITSNINDGQLVDYYSPELVKRLREACEIIPVTGKEMG